LQGIASISREVGIVFARPSPNVLANRDQNAFAFVLQNVFADFAGLDVAALIEDVVGRQKLLGENLRLLAFL
jgi:hypothetical protein